MTEKEVTNVYVATVDGHVIGVFTSLEYAMQEAESCVTVPMSIEHNGYSLEWRAWFVDGWILRFEAKAPETNGSTNVCVIWPETVEQAAQRIERS